MNSFSNKVAAHLCEKLQLSDDSVPVYAYGLELLFAATLNILLIILAAFIFRRPYAWIFFLLAFIPLRVTAGGYHAGTHFRCTIVCLVAFIITITLTYCIHDIYRPMISVISCLFNLATVICLSPVQAVQKPLTSNEQRINRNRSLSLAIFSLGISFLSLYWRFTSAILFFSLGVLTAAISQIAGKIQFTVEGRRTHE